MTPGRVGAVLVVVLSASLALAVGPPPREPPEVAKLIAQLGDEDLASRKAAMKKLEALGDAAAPALRRAAADARRDVDVRLRAAVVARAIHAREWGLVKAFGPGATLTERPFGDGYWFNRVRFTRDGKYAVVAGGAVILYDLNTGKEVKRVLEVQGARLSLEVSRDGKRVLTGHSNAREIHLLEVPSLKTARVIGNENSFENTRGALAPDGEHIALAMGHEWLELTSLKTGRHVRSFEGHQGSPRALAISPDGKLLLVGLEKYWARPTDELVVLYDVKSGKMRGLRIHTKNVTGVAFRPGGKKAVSSSDDGSLRVWEVASGKELRKMDHGSYVNDLAVSPDGRRALTAGFHDRLVKVWDLETGRLLEAFEGHVGAVLGVAFSPDGRRALSCDSVACVRLWKLGR